jgi:replicative DNA helicase
MSSPETLVLSGLLKNLEYARKVVPFIKLEYFADSVDRLLFEEEAAFFERHNSLPSRMALEIEVGKRKLSEDENTKAMARIAEADGVAFDHSMDWALTETEEFCKDRALYNAIFESISIIDGKNTAKEKLSKNAIPDLLEKALSVSFDAKVGHAYVTSVEERYRTLHKHEAVIPFRLTTLNKITNNGIPKKTLCIVAAPTGGGKSIFLCDHAAHCLLQNLNVVYITMEMSEERIAERIDANIMKTTINELRDYSEDMYVKKFKRSTAGLKTGRLFIKEYPTSTANVLHFRHYLSELKMKHNFTPDVVIVDYLNICASSRYKASASVNSYTMVKAIAEELRGLAVEQNVQLFSATQVNREGITSTDVGLQNTSESMGLAHTADFYLAMTQNEQLALLNQMMFKQLKNRFNDMAIMTKFVVGLDKGKMTFYDLDDSAQASLTHVENSENSPKPEMAHRKPVFKDPEEPEKSGFDAWD